MVNEIYEAQEYVKGNNIDLKNLYRIYVMMVRWHKSQGLDKIEIRNVIAKWKKKHGIDIRSNTNEIIARVFDRETNPELSTPVVKINKQDVANINRRFDSKKTKLVALAMLCYAKAYANEDGEFNISLTSLSAWTGVNRHMLGRKYIKELVDYEYLTVVSKYESKNYWEFQYREQSTKYRLNFKLVNTGDFELENNDLQELYAKLNLQSLLRKKI